MVIEKQWTADRALAFPSDSVGVLMRFYSSNVYEGASADVLIEGQERNIPIKELIRVEDMQKERE